MSEVSNMKFATMIAIVGITILEGLAIWKSLDSSLLWLAITAIAGLGGYAVSQTQKVK